MAKKSSTRKKKNSRKNKKRSSGGGRPPPRKRDDGAALRGMMVGGAIVVLLAVLFLVPIGGATPFSHLLDAVGLAGGEETEAPVDSAAPGAAAPQEELSEKEQQGLDDLIDKKKK